jgi:hypothetical protein
MVRGLLARAFMRKTTLASASISIVFAAACGATTPEEGSDESALGAASFANPVIPMYDRPPGVPASDPAGVPHEKTEGCPDPTGMRTRGGDYFIYCTSYTFPFGRLNGFPVFKSASRSLAGPWKPVGSIIPDRSDSREAWPRWVRDTNGKRDGSFWAPDVHQLPNGKFAAEYSAPCGDARWGDRRCVGVAWSDGPDGPWTHAQDPFITPENNGAHGNAYDATLLVAEDGALYTYWVEPGAGVFERRVKADGRGKLDWFDGARPVLVADHRPPKNQHGEGPYVVEHGGAYYEFYSTGSLFFSYHVGVRRGARPDAPFDVEGPEVVHANAHFVATGGNSVVDDGRGHEFLVYHAIVVPPGGGCPRENPVWGGNVAKTADNPHCRVEGDRQAMIDEIEWKRFPDGIEWPVLKNGKGTPSR